MIARTPRALASWMGAAVVIALVARARADEREACASAAEAAQHLRASGKLVASRSSLLRCVVTSCPRVVQRDCVQWLAEVDAQMPSVIVRAYDARGRDVVGVRVSIDGAPLLETLDGTPRSVDPGARLFRFEATGGAVEEQTVLVSAGVKNRVVDAHFRVDLRPDGSPEAPPIVAPSPSTSAVATPPPLASAKPPRPVAPARPPPAPTFPWAFIVGGVGLVGFGVYGYAELSGQADYRRMRDGCGATGACSSQQVDGVRTRLYYVAPVALAVGAIGLGVGAVLFVTARTKDGGDASRVGVEPIAGGGVASFSSFF